MGTPAGFLRDFAARAVDLLTSFAFLDFVAEALLAEDETASAAEARVLRAPIVVRVRLTGVTRVVAAFRLRGGGLGGDTGSGL